MTPIDALLLGIVQGLTEFLPVSSSAHLVMGEEILAANEPGIAFDVLVHGGTLLAVLLYFRARIVELVRMRSWSYAGKIVVGTIPAGIVGLLFESAIERVFDDPVVVVGTLFVTGAFLLSLRAIPPDRPEVTVPRNRKLTSAQRAQAMVHVGDLHSSEVDEGRTTKSRTLCDCLRGRSTRHGFGLCSRLP